jgi:hypothetical protein
MRLSRGIAPLAVLFSSATLASCVYPTERDDSVHVSVAALPILLRGDDTYGTARAWRMLGSTDSLEIANVTFVWSSDVPSIASVDANGHIVGIKSGTTTIRAAAANFDKRALVGETPLRISASLEIDSIRPQLVRYGERVTVYGFGLDSTVALTLGANAFLFPVPFSQVFKPDGSTSIAYWVPPPAHTDSLFFIGSGVFGFSHDTVHVTRHDLYEPNKTSAAVIDLETSRPFPGTFLNFFMFLNPALAFEGLPRGVTRSADWFRFRQSTTRDLTIVLNADVPGTFQTFLTDSLGYRTSDTTWFIGRNAWTFGPQSHACHGAAFGPKEAPAESTIVALHDFADTSLHAIAVYTREGRYELAVIEGYALSDKRIARDTHEEDNFCDAADLKPVVFSASGEYVDTLAIENPHDVDWFRFTVSGSVAQPVRFRTAARPFAAADSSDIDLYVLNVPASGDTVMTGFAIAKAGSTVDTTLSLAPKDYYAVVVDFAGVPTRYSLCIGFPHVPLTSPKCATLPASAPVGSSAAELRASVLRRARLEAAIRRRSSPFR